MGKNNFIGISEDRLHHIIGVARKAYKIAKEKKYSEGFARKCFLLGWLHDVGYEFSETQEEHPKISEQLMHLLEADYQEMSNVIGKHGKEIYAMAEEDMILNMADMLVDAKGNEVSINERLEGIKERYGEKSEQYRTAKAVCKNIGLL